MMQTIQGTCLSQSKKILLCGYFAFDTDDFGGQPVKSRALYWALREYYGLDNVHFIETMGWKRHPFKLLMDFVYQMQFYDRIIMLPAHNGLGVFSKLLYLAKRVFRKKVYYSVIGGWLGDKVKQNRRLKQILQKFDGIWVETTSMKEALLSEGFSNVEIVPNFRNLQPVLELNQEFNEPLPLCMFSRVMEEKGIEDAVQAVINVNSKLKKQAFTLHIYGQVHEPYQTRFEQLQKQFPDYICYKGIIPSAESVGVLQKYFALLFPTHFYTEGIPGTLVEALFSGLPVITSLWQNCEDVFEEGITGWGYQFGKTECLEYLLCRANEYQQAFLDMRKNCLKKSSQYSKETVLKNIHKLLE